MRRRHPFLAVPILLLAACFPRMQLPPPPPPPEPRVAAVAAPPRPTSETCIPRQGSTAAPADKRKRIEDLLRDGGAALLHLDARRPGVVLPPYVSANPHLIIQIGRALTVPIGDLLIDDEGVSGTLSFHQTPFFCRIPWSAIYVAVSVEKGVGAVWEKDVPATELCD